MPAPRRLTRAAVPLALTLAAVGCGGAERELRPEERAAEAALALFELARQREPTADEIDGIVAPDCPARQRATLRAALDELARLPRPRVVGVEELPGLDRAVVDLWVELPGGGASYSVQLARDAQAWRVHWLSGPGLSWPSYPAPQPGLAGDGRGAAADDATDRARPRRRPGRASRHPR